MIKRKFKDFLDTTLFDFIYQVLYEPLENSQSKLIDYIRKGLIVYQDGKLKSKYFTATLSKEIKEMGGQWKNGGYLIAPNLDLQQAIDYSIKEQSRKINVIRQYIDESITNTDNSIKSLDLSDTTQFIVQDMTTDLSKSTEVIKDAYKFAISPDMTDLKIKNISENYTNNLEKSIKGMLEDELPKFRNNIEDLVFSGVRREDLKKLINKEYNIFGYRSELIAKQETSLVLTEYKATHYQEAGCRQFMWKHTSISKTDNEYHKNILDGKIFDYDNPPVIDLKSGERGLPGQFFNCSCIMLPLINKNYLKDK